MTQESEPQREMNSPPLVIVAGTHRLIGRQIGEACREQIQRSIYNSKVLIQQSRDQLELDWDSAKNQARKYMPFVQERFPQYLEELMGMAEGANVQFEDLSTINCIEALTSDAIHLDKCTSLAVSDSLTADGHVLVAHNEDWLPEDEDDVYLVHVTPEKEPPFLAMTYGGLLPNIGFNAYGIAQCCDSVYPNDSRIGIPRIFVSRSVLAAKTLADAIGSMIAPQRAAGYNHLLAHESGEIYNIEVSARKFAILYGLEGYLAHTNFYLDRNMQAVEFEPDELIGTRVRYFRAMRLLRESEMHTVKTIQAILRDHVSYPNSICNHLDSVSDPLDRQKTINSLVIDLATHVMHFSWGNPCKNPYNTFYLDA